MDDRIIERFRSVEFVERDGRMHIIKEYRDFDRTVESSMAFRTKAQRRVAYRAMDYFFDFSGREYIYIRNGAGVGRTKTRRVIGDYDGNVVMSEHGEIIDVIEMEKEVEATAYIPWPKPAEPRPSWWKFW